MSKARRYFPFHYRDWLDVVIAAIILIIYFAVVVVAPLVVVLHFIIKYW